MLLLFTVLDMDHCSSQLKSGEHPGPSTHKHTTDPTPRLHILTVTQICIPWRTYTHTRTYICTQICIHWHRPTLNWTHNYSTLFLSCTTMIFVSKSWCFTPSQPVQLYQGDLWYLNAHFLNPCDISMVAKMGHRNWSHNDCNQSDTKLSMFTTTRAVLTELYTQVPSPSSARTHTHTHTYQTHHTHSLNVLHFFCSLAF